MAGAALAIRLVMQANGALDRNRLITDHVEMARRISLFVARRCPNRVSREDLVAAGLLGLTEAAARFNETRSEAFLPFAEKRIRGAVLDELRRGDIMPRRVRQIARRVGRAVDELEQRLGHAPEDADVAAELGVTVEVYRDEYKPLLGVQIDAIGEGERGLPPSDTAVSPEAEAGRRQELERMHHAIGRMEDRDVAVLSYYYADELTYGETGRRMGVTTSRVCQLHGRAISRLRAALGDS